MRVLRVIVVFIVMFGSARGKAQSIFTYAGGGTVDNRPAMAIGIDPKDVAVDRDGHVYFADELSYAVRRVDSRTGLVATVAGNDTGSIGGASLSGDGGPALLASVGVVSAVTIENDGSILIGNRASGGISSGLNRVRRVDASTGIIETLWVADFGVDDLETDAEGNVWVLTGRQNLGIILPSGPYRLVTDALTDLEGIAYDPRNRRLLTSSSRKGIHAVDLQGNVSLFVRKCDVLETGVDGIHISGSCGHGAGGIAVGEDGAIYFSDRDYTRSPYANVIRRVDPATGVVERLLSRPSNVAISDMVMAPDASLVFVDYPRISVYSAGAGSRTLAGNGTYFEVGDHLLAPSARLHIPEQIFVDANDDLYIADYSSNRIRRMDGNGRVTTVVGTGLFGQNGNGLEASVAQITQPKAVAVGPNGDIYIVEAGGTFERVDFDTGLLWRYGSLRGWYLSVDPAGRLYQSGYSSHDIKELDPETGTVLRRVAGSGSGDFSGDGGAATAAGLQLPRRVAFDSAGNMFVAGGCRVRRIDAMTGIIQTVLGSGICSATNPTTGESYTLWNAPPLNTRLDPFDIQVEDDAHLLISANAENGLSGQVLRLDLSQNRVSLVAGNGTDVYTGDGGPATAAGLVGVRGLAIKSNGDILVADAGSRRIRVIPKCREVGGVSGIGPVNDSAGVSQSTVLRWTPSDGALSYDVYVDTVTPPRVRMAAGNSTTLSLSDLEPLTKYYWKVVSRGDPFCDEVRSAESEVWSFTTTSSCNQPIVLEPGSASD